MDNTLLVPMELDALVANNQLLQRDNFRWWSYNYLALDRFKSAEPMPFSSNFTGQQPGIYLHWTLPRSIRTANTDYPLVPNRWLILRMSRSSALTGWVLESDCPTSATNPAVNATPYLIDPGILARWRASADSLRVNGSVYSTDPNQPMVANIGVPFAYDTWHERTTNTAFLTAVSPGNAAFSEYVYHNMNIFSFYDDLNKTDKDTLSYFVTGWYSEPGSDIIHSGGTTDEILNALNWTLASNASSAAITSSVYTGAVFSINWDRNGAPPANDSLELIRSNASLNVAIGNNTIDAFSTLLGEQLAGYENADQTIALLRAFQYDMLPLLNQANGDALLEEKIRDSWFSSRPGGTAWVITPSATTPAWLTQLNLDQKALDDAMETVRSLQWDLNAAWWKYNHANKLIPPPTQYPASQFLHLLDPLDPSSPLEKLLGWLEIVNTLRSKVPQPIHANGRTEQEAFLAGVTAFANSKGLAAGSQLKAVVKPRYYKAKNPVVVVSGIEPSTAADIDASLTVRVPSQLITKFFVNGVAADTGVLSKTIPTLSNTAAFPGVIPGLFAEFFLLDPANAPVIANVIKQPVNVVQQVMNTHNYPGVILPDRSLDNWTQDWQPIYLEWKVSYQYVPFNSNNWTFNGTDYDLSPGASSEASATAIGNISLLSSHAQDIFNARLQTFVNTYGNTTQLQQLDNWIQQVDGWKFLTQELVDFGNILTQRDGRAFRRPNKESFTYRGQTLYYDDMIGFQAGPATGPYVIPPEAVGHVNTVPFIDTDVYLPFHGMREGQLFFTDLMIYDKFGRVLNLILSGSGAGIYDANNFPLITDKALSVTHNITPAVSAPVQLPPRLHQYGKLDIFFTDPMNDNNITNVNPICGWIIPNHLDQSLLLYAADGSSLGELSIISTRQVVWNAPPHTTLTMAQVAVLAPHVANFVNNITGRGDNDFTALLTAIDSTLWTIDPLGDRSDQDLTVLVGRPLALVRSTLQFSIEGEPIVNAGWASTFNTPAPDFTNYNFGIRLGDQATRNDGVIGYFSNYSVFNSVVAPPAGQTYVQQIGGPARNYINLQFNDNSKIALTLLVDPRAVIHATTGILPVKEVSIPPSFVEGPLRNMEISFRSGPVLTQLLTDVSQLTLLPLAEQHGSWSWWEKTSGSAWRNYSLAKATTNAALQGITTLREGVLQLVNSLTKK